MPAREPQDRGRAANAEPAQQQGFFRIPARFGNVPVAELPLGYDPEKRFERLYPRIELPFQVVERAETGTALRHDVNDLFPDGLNRLFFGDCLHVMRMLPSESLDLIYIDPPFFSGRNYNIVFGDRNEVRSFSDIWEGGMPGYLIWLNARLYEMKRLLRDTGNIVVHCDWHASHYIKLELDRLFGYESFRNEIVWSYHSGGASSRYFSRKHDVLFWYAKNSKEYFFEDRDARAPYTESTIKAYNKTDSEGNRYKLITHRDGTSEKVFARNLDRGRLLTDVWEDIPHLANWSAEKVGYPTQKPEKLIDRVIRALSPPGGVVADFVCGGGTTLAVAQMLGRKWIGSDVSRVAVAITAERLAGILAPTLATGRSRPREALGEGPEQGSLPIDPEMMEPETREAQKARALEASPLPIVGHTIEHWGIYDIDKLTLLRPDEFREFVLACYGASGWTGASQHIHGTKGNEVLWVGNPEETDIVTATNVKLFAEAVLKTRAKDDRDAVMIAWNIDPNARAYAERIMLLGQQRPIQAIRLRLWSLAGEDFRSHITKRRPEYQTFFSFILRPDIPRIGVTRLSARRYEFSASEAHSMNPGGSLTNAQWDFRYTGFFRATRGYELCRRGVAGLNGSTFVADLKVAYTFETEEPGTEVAVACRVQDDLGGEQTSVVSVVVE